MSFKLNAEVIQHFINKGFHLYILNCSPARAHIVLRNDKYSLSFNEFYSLLEKDHIEDISDVSICSINDVENKTYDSEHHMYYESFSSNDDVFSYVDEMISFLDKIDED